MSGIIQCGLCISGVHLEQDLYCRLIDSSTKQVRRCIQNPRDFSIALLPPHVSQTSIGFRAVIAIPPPFKCPHVRWVGVSVEEEVISGPALYMYCNCTTCRLISHCRAINRTSRRGGRGREMLTGKDRKRGDTAEVEFSDDKLERSGRFWVVRLRNWPPFCL